MPLSWLCPHTHTHWVARFFQDPLRIRRAPADNGNSFYSEAVVEDTKCNHGYVNYSSSSRLYLFISVFGFCLFSLILINMHGFLWNTLHTLLYNMLYRAFDSPCTTHSIVHYKSSPGVSNIYYEHVFWIFYTQWEDGSNLETAVHSCCAIKLL